MSAYFGAITLPQAPSSLPLLYAKYQPNHTTKESGIQTDKTDAPMLQSHYSLYFLAFSEHV